MRIPMRLKLLIIPIGVCLMLFMAISGTVFASGLHPHVKGSESATTTGGCITIKVHGSDFTPSTTTTQNSAYLFTIASTDHSANGQTVVPVNADGNFSAPFTICGITVVPDTIEYIVQDGVTGFYSNTAYTKAK